MSHYGYYRLRADIPLACDVICQIHFNLCPTAVITLEFIRVNTNTTKEPDIFEQIELEVQKQSEYLKLKDGEVRILEFDPDTKQIRIVDSKFNGSKRVEYIVGES